MASIFMMRARQSHARRKAGKAYGSDLEEVKGDQRKATNSRVARWKDNSVHKKENERRDAPKYTLKEIYDFIDNLKG